CEYVAENKDKVRAELAAARYTGTRGRTGPKSDDTLALRSKAVPLPKPHKLLGYVEESKDGRRVRTDEPKEDELHYMGGAEPTLTVRRPYAYLVPATFPRVVENLQRHGIEVDELREDIELD